MHKKTVFVDPRTAEEEGRVWSSLFIALAIFSVVAGFLHTFCFSVSCEALTAHLRSLSFKAIMRQEIGWFNLEQNSTGALTTTPRDCQRMPVKYKELPVCWLGSLLPLSTAGWSSCLFYWSPR